MIPAGISIQLAAAPWLPLHFVPAGNLLGILPILIVGGGAVIVLLADLMVPRRGNLVLPVTAGIVLLGALGTAAGQWAVHAAHPIVFNGAYADDRFALFADFVILLTALAVVALSPGYLRRRGMEEGEYYTLLLASVTGMLVLTGALNLIVVFLGIELLSIPLYVLAGFARDEPLPQEAAMKYLLLGGFASGFLLYGMALIYGETGHTGLVAIHRVLTTTAVSQQFDPMLLAGIALLAVGRPDGTQASLYYLAAYAFMNTGAFAVITILSRRGEDCDRYSQLSGLGRRQPFLAGLMSIFMLSLAGFPLTVGFFGKFFLFSAAIHDGQLALAIWGILTSAVSLFYYLRVILIMFSGATEPVSDEAPQVAGVSLDGAAIAAPDAAVAVGVSSGLVVLLAGAGTLVLGIFPALIYTLLQGITVVHG